VLRSGRVLSRAGVRVLAALSLVLLFVGAPSAQASPDIKQKLSAASDDLAQASKAVNAAMAALDRARTQLPAAQAALAAALDAKATAQRAAAAAAVAESRATAVVLDAQRRLVAAKQRIVDMNREIGNLSRAVYMAGPYNELAAILSAATPSDFADQLEAIRSVSRSQNKTLADLEAARADVALATIQAQQAKDQATAAAALATASLAKAASAASRALAAKAHVDALVRARAQGLAIAAKEKARVKKQYLALKAEQTRLAALERRSSGSRGFTGTPSGSLIWPIPGASIVGGVGWRVHPVYGYKSCHTGEDIRGTFGTPILAAADGKVILVANSGAYGLHTVISHGGGISTMSAHQSATAVHVGEIVRQGQVIGYVGASGWVTGPHLHWEVHVNGVPYDPMGWFGFPRVPVPCWNG
jgi:murein DD-endopeptidase MepM/ murein hydrolase activator NlpD